MGIFRDVYSEMCAASAASILLLAASTCLAQDMKPEDIDKALFQHFTTVTPELMRERVSASYGETTSLTAISKDALAREISLFKDVIAAGLLKSPSPMILALGHNLMVHDPLAGLAYLKALHESANLGDNNVGQAIVVATVASGEPGEKMAVSELMSQNQEQRAFWAHYLEYYAISLSSVEPIQKHLAHESDPAIKASLLRALSMIGSPSSLEIIKSFVLHAAHDEVQAAAIFAYAELAGYDGITFIETVNPLGALSSREQQDSLSWLRSETSTGSKHGREVSSDSGFVTRFRELLSSPVIGWLNDQGLLKEDVLKNPPQLNTDRKKELLDILIDSRGFGLEAVKGALYRSLAKEDEALLLQIRAVSFYSPNAMSSARLNTIGIMVRQIRQEL